MNTDCIIRLPTTGVNHAFVWRSCRLIGSIPKPVSFSQLADLDQGAPLTCTRQTSLSSGRCVPFLGDDPSTTSCASWVEDVSMIKETG